MTATDDSRENGATPEPAGSDGSQAEFMNAQTISPGRYRHYKGNEYTVLGVARHSETEEPIVVYRQEYGDHGLWVRPLGMFLEKVLVNGEQVPRFRWTGEE